MKFKYIGKDNRGYTKGKIYLSNEFYDSHIGIRTNYTMCDRICVITDNGHTYNLEKIYWEIVYEEVHKGTEVINTQTNEMKYALLTRTIGNEVYIIVKHNQETLAWRYTDCEIVTKEVTETLIDNNDIMNTLDKLIADEEFSAEVMADIAYRYKKIKSQIKNLEEDIKSKQELLDFNNDLAYQLNEGVETKNILLIERVKEIMGE